MHAMTPRTAHGIRPPAEHATAHVPDVETERVASDGKLPSWSAWRERVAERTASWDGLLTEAGLASFAADQAALDDRIRGLL